MDSTKHLSPAPGTLVAWLRHDDLQARTDGQVDYLYIQGKLVPGYSEIGPTQTVVCLAHMTNAKRTKTLRRLAEIAGI
jgi:hypothetical protein